MVVHNKRDFPGNSGKVSGHSEISMDAIIYGSPIPQFAIDMNHRVIYWNLALEKYSGIKAEDVMGTDRHWQIFYPLERACMADLLVDGLEDRIPELYDVKKRKFPFLEGTYNGANFFPEIGESGAWIYLTVAPVRDENGRVTGYLETLWDITELKEVEDTLRERELYIRTIMDNLPIGISVNSVRPKVSFEYFNDNFLKFYRITPEALSVPDLFWDAVYEDPVFREEIRKRVLEDIAGGKPDKMYWEDIPITRSGEETTYISAMNIPVPDKNIVISTVWDVTERKKAQLALSMANNKLNMLSSITRHDILNLIMVIRGYLEMSEETDDETTIKKYILKEKEAVNEIQLQIEFTGYYQDIGVNEPKWQNSFEVVSVAARSLGLEYIQIDNSLKKVEIFADPLIGKVFYNLMDNSVRHGGDVTAISLSCYDSNRGLVIAYTDNGVGILEKDREKLFRKGHGRNTGLGLFLSREILSITGIAINETGNAGEGVRFEITFPKGNYRLISDV